MERNPYQVLGVEPGASADEIKDAYRLRVRLLHPDRHAGNDSLLMDEATKATAELNEAWSVLSDSDARARYDAEARFGANQKSYRGEEDHRRTRSPASGECTMCGSYPAVPIELRKISGRVLFMTRETMGLDACRPCGTALFRSTTNHCLLFGWWGLKAAFFNVLALVQNFRSWNMIRGLAQPTKSESVDAPLGAPMDQGPPLHHRLGIWVTAALLVVVVIALSAPSGSDDQPTSPQMPTCFGAGCAVRHPLP